MTQEEFSALKPGDKVRIVKEKTGFSWNRAGLMDKWLGQVMTVRENECFGIRMEEDKNDQTYSLDSLGWYWGPEMIECKVEDAPAEAKDKKEDKMRIVDEKGFLVDDEYFKEEKLPIDQLVMEREETRKIPRADLRKRFLRELTGEKGPFEWSDFGVEFTQRWDEVSLEMVMECFDRAMEAEE